MGNIGKNDSMLWLRRPEADKSLEELSRSIEYMEHRLLDYRYHPEIIIPITRTYQRHIAEYDKRNQTAQAERARTFLANYCCLYVRGNK